MPRYLVPWLHRLFTDAAAAVPCSKTGQLVSGAILFEKTLHQDASGGTLFTNLLQAIDIVPGIKVNLGLKSRVVVNKGELWCNSLTGLYTKCVTHFARRAQFATSGARSSASM